MRAWSMRTAFARVVREAMTVSRQGDELVGEV